ncbi:MAG TPA: hypothetical protein VE974_12910 [Thermoanaerobaculia bacterium]|nr:hypothetical protein [Thermoanaerobaculia bacterium]
MNELTAKIRQVEQDIAREKGPLNLLALLEREDLFDRWDFVVSASWAKHDGPTFRYLADTIKRHLTPAEMTRLARMVILDAGEDPVKAITESYPGVDEPVELNNPERFDLPAKHGYIITSRSAA